MAVAVQGVAVRGREEVVRELDALGPQVTRTKQPTAQYDLQGDF